MTRTLRALILGLLLAGSGVGVAAQDDACPVAHVCIPYKTRIIEIDPELGPYQMVVVAERWEDRTVTIRDIEGERVEKHSDEDITLAGFVSDGDTYHLHREYVEPRDGIFAEADYGDVFVLVETE